MKSGDELNIGVLDKIENRATNRAEIETRASTRVDVAKRPEYRNRVVAQTKNKADFSKRLVFLDRIIKTLDGKDITNINRADIRQETNFGIIAIVELGGLVTRDKIITRVLDKANIRGSNKISVTKKLDFKDKVIAEVQNKVNSEAINNHIENFLS